MANGYEKRLIRVLDHIHDNPAGDLSLDKLAEVAALSRFHFHRVFQAMTGETAAQAVRRMRLYRASVGLVHGTDSLAKIAKASGFPSVAALNRAFTDSYGMSPTAFRKRGTLRPQPPQFVLKGIQMYPVEIRNEPARRFACVAHQGSYLEIGRAFEKLGATIGARGLFADVGRMVRVYYNSPDNTVPEDLRSHAGFEMATAEIAPPLQEVHLPKGRHAVLTFKGPYSGLHAGYSYLFGAWLQNSGEVPADAPPFEVYLNTPMDTAPENLITEICLPLV